MRISKMSINKQSLKTGTKNKKISVIVPVYNEEKYVSQCISSLLSQTKKPDEILVADDGSTDRTVHMMSRFPVKLYKRRHLGVSKQCNFLARKAKGDILVRLDADMYYDKHYIAKITEPIEKGETIATFTKEEYVANPENLWSACWSLHSGLPIHKRIPISTPNKAWNFRAIVRNEFLKVGGYDESLGYGEDDRSVLVKSGKPLAVAVRGARCYHYNPETLSEVFFSSRFIGRGELYRNRLARGLLIHSFLNSLRKGILMATKIRKPEYVIFKLVFDAGMSIGMLERKFTGRQWK